METFKVFMVFGFADYYPTGGIGDCIGSFDTLPEALSFAFEQPNDYLYIFDRIEGVIVWDKDDKKITI